MNPPQGAQDPLLAEQWHLNNTGQNGGVVGEDARVFNAWDQGLSGAGVRIAVIDDGLEVGHEDLAPNVVAGASHNYVNGGSDPTGGSHGTSCAGVAAAAANALGGRGAGYNANLVGYNVLANLTTTNEADAMTRGLDTNWISSNSWGPPDGTGTPQPASSTWVNAVVEGVTQGRNGLGTCYFWAAGNGDSAQGPVDNSNYDGQANFVFVMAVGAVGDDGTKAFYSENGANLLVCAPSLGNSGQAITTVDRTGGGGYNDGNTANDYTDPNYTNTFNGTSSATPLVAGVAAMVLEVDPQLTWRDVRKILAQSARRNDAGDPDWQLNAGGHWVNHKYGFGVVDADAAVQLAANWQALPPLQNFLPATSNVGQPIPDNDVQGISDTIDVVGSGIQNIEMVEILFSSSDHTWSSDLEIVLTSPAGTSSVLAERHGSVNNPPPFDGFIFSSTRHLDEAADGTWTLTVRDLFQQDSGTFESWAINVLGH
ncbi:MAG: S8 family serine peptidase [Planctomycetota bacterium]